MVLPRQMRIKGHRCFDYLHKVGARYHGPNMVLRVAKANFDLQRSHKVFRSSDSCRCAVAISSKVSKKAVIRNRLRRLFHDHLQLKLSESRGSRNNWALISLKPNSSSQETSQLMEECDKLLRKAGLVL